MLHYYVFLITRILFITFMIIMYLRLTAVSLEYKKTLREKRGMSIGLDWQYRPK